MHDAERHVTVGRSAVAPKCAADAAGDTRPADGVWIVGAVDPVSDDSPMLIEPQADAVARAQPVIHLQVRRNDQPPEGRGPARSTALVLGVGADPAVARTILSTVVPAPR